MPPLHMLGRAIEPRLYSAPAPVKKDVGGYGVGYSGFGFGAWGFLPGSSGVAITPYTALQSATAYLCVKRISEDIGKLPRVIRRRLSRGSRVDLDHPLNRLLRNPNRWQTPSQCWAYTISWMALRGNAYGVVVRDEGGMPEMFIPVSPDRVSPMLSPKGEMFYQISHPYFGVSRTFHRDNVVHLRTAISLDGYTGVSPIAVAQDVFGLAVATQQHGAVLFRQGAQLNGIISHPGKLSPEAKTYLRENFSARFAGVQQAHQTPVLDEGMKFEKQTMTNEDSQFIESRKFSAEEIAKMFGVPPHKAGDYEHAHFANMEQANLEYWQDTLLPIGNQLREELSRVMLFEDEQDYLTVDTDWDELNRTDRKTRYETYQIGILNGIINRNEARLDDNREPVEGGDEFRVPLNTAPPGTKPTPNSPGTDAGDKPVPAEGENQDAA